jgi:hypothetical protein
MENISNRKLFCYTNTKFFFNFKKLMTYRNWENHSQTDCSVLRQNYMKNLKSQSSRDRYEKMLHPPASKRPRQLVVETFKTGMLYNN